ncbi:MAG: hypothetical protein HOP19_14915, partial [Acidobacteria bacterium]|nr:hypothetical protein [Acidobacteriota bacterium]
MRNITLALILLLATTGAAWAQADAKADAIIKQARAAIGKEDKFKAMQTLSAEGMVRSQGPNGQQEVTLELEMMTPDKIKLTQTMQFGTIIRAFDGTGTWNDFIPAVGMGGGPGGGGMRMMGGGPGGPGGGPGGANSPMATYMQQQQRREFYLLFMGFFLAPPPATQMTYAFVGEAPGPEGTKLNVVDAKTADGIVTRLYFNQESNRLIGMSYKGKQMRFGRGGAPGGQAGGQAGGQGGQQRPQAEGGQRQGGQAPAPAGGNAQGGGQGQGGGQRQQMTPEERERRAKEMQE